MKTWAKWALGIVGVFVALGVLGASTDPPAEETAGGGAEDAAADQAGDEPTADAPETVTPSAPAPDAAAPPTGQAPAAPDEARREWEQSWTRSYGETTCVHWVDEMDAHERRVAAGDMLLAARKRDGDASVPPLALMQSFHEEVDLVCRNQGYQVEAKINEVAAFIYLYDERYQP